MAEDIKGYVIHKTSNANASNYTTLMQSFDGSNTFGRWRHKDLWQPADELYIVYSYGEHHPMYIYSTLLKQWFENGDRQLETQSTKRHYTQLKPKNTATTIKSHLYMKKVAQHGVVGTTRERVTRAASAWVNGKWR
jgi:hypothetical protein